MADDRVVTEIVTRFFLSTCQPRRRLNADTLAVMMASSQVIVSGAICDNAFDLIPLSTGSVAEFYIEPMLPCFGDIDVMCFASFLLATPQGHPPPAELPDEFHCSFVLVCEITDVHLVLSQLLTEVADNDGKYNAVPCPPQYIAHYLVHLLSAQGPAIAAKFPNPLPSVTGSICISASPLSYDGMSCVRCLSWPLQAADWPTRHRNYGWPDTTVLDRVVSNGCDVVLVAHRRCRQDEWMSKHQ